MRRLKRLLQLENRLLRFAELPEELHAKYLDLIVGFERLQAAREGATGAGEAARDSETETPLSHRPRYVRKVDGTVVRRDGTEGRMR